MCCWPVWRAILSDRSGCEGDVSSSTGTTCSTRTHIATDSPLHSLPCRWIAERVRLLLLAGFWAVWALFESQSRRTSCSRLLSARFRCASQLSMLLWCRFCPVGFWIRPLEKAVCCLVSLSRVQLLLCIRLVLYVATNFRKLVKFLTFLFIELI